MTECNMRVCVGTDVESIADVATALERYGDRYARRLFTDYEITICGGSVAAAAPRLAARFAAKEAVMKLLSPTDDDPTEKVPRWRSIEVRTAANGAPSIQLHSEAADLAREQGIGPLSLSMSHGAGIGMATVVALATTDRG
jgi:holo-[acyl-carrier protein] synthase